MSIVKQDDIKEVTKILVRYDRDDQIALCAVAMNDAARDRLKQAANDRQNRIIDSERLRFDDGDKYDGVPADTGSI